MSSKTRAAAFCSIALLALPAFAADSGQETRDRGPSVPALREKLRVVFQERLRSAVGLSDAQMEAVSPVLERLQSERVAIRQERLRIIRDLRKSLRSGGSDAEIDALLAHLDQLGVRQEETTRDALRDVDRHLKPRQKVELRFFVARFRQDVEARIMDVRERRLRSGRDPAERREALRRRARPLL